MMPTASVLVLAAAAQSYRGGRQGVAVVLVVLVVLEAALAEAEQGRTVARAVRAGSLVVVVPSPDPD